MIARRRSNSDSIAERGRSNSGSTIAAVSTAARRTRREPVSEMGGPLEGPAQ
jgi:hypothetical protein